MHMTSTATAKTMPMLPSGVTHGHVGAGRCDSVSCRYRGITMSRLIVAMRLKALILLGERGIRVSHRPCRPAPP